MDPIQTLRAQREAIVAELRSLAELAVTEERGFTADEDTDRKAKRGRVDALDARIADLEAEEARKAAAGDAATRVPTVRVKSEPLTYQRGSEHSYFLDLARATTGRGDVAGAQARLARHTQEMDVEMTRREEKRAATAENELRALGEGSSFERRTNPNRTDGQGGYFVPPLWLVDEFIPLLRAGRVFANSVRQMELPSGTDSINIPKVSTGTSTAAQTADGGGVSSTDATDTSVSAGVKTIAGQQDIALQLLEQSPIGFDDQVIFPDLIADYNRNVDKQALNGSNASGQVKGIIGLAPSGNAVTYTDASPTGPELYLPLAQVVSNVSTNRLAPPTAFFMHPRRWYWLASQLDSANRPLVVPAQNGPFNAAALQTGVAAEGPVGYVLGLPILLDPNITTTAGGGTEDRIYAVRTPDVYLWEGALRSRTLMEVLSGTLQVRLQVYNYVAFMADRYVQSIGEISGTGLAAPSGF